MRKTIRIIIILAAVLQIVGGLLGIYSLYKNSLNPEYLLLKSLLLVSPAILLNLIGGISLFWSKLPKAVILAGVNYLTQIFQFHLFGFYYFNASGPYIGIGFVKRVGSNLTFWMDKAEFIATNIITVDKNLSYSFFVTTQQRN